MERGAVERLPRFNGAACRSTRRVGTRLDGETAADELQRSRVPEHAERLATPGTAAPSARFNGAACRSTRRGPYWQQPCQGSLTNSSREGAQSDLFAQAIRCSWCW